MKEAIIRLLSWFWDIPIEKTSSPQNDYLEVVWTNGRKMLNTKEANFSFGNGYKVFETAMKPIADKIQVSKDILILGFGCGSILHLLEEKYEYNGNIVGVEYDSEILRLFHSHFASNYIKSPTLYSADALEHLKSLEKRYDIIFIDLFIELDNSPLLRNKRFINLLHTSLRPKGTLVFNTTVKGANENTQHTELLNELSRHFKNIESIDFQDYNKIVIAS
jgi:spermidine synthase